MFIMRVMGKFNFETYPYRNQNILLEVNEATISRGQA